MFSGVTFYLETVTTNIAYKTISSACFPGAFVILTSSLNICNTFDTSLPYPSFPYEKSCRLGYKCHVCVNSFKMKYYIPWVPVQDKGSNLLCVKFGAMKIIPSDRLHQEYLTISLRIPSD